MAHIFSDLDVCDNAFFWNYDDSFIIEWGLFFRWCPLLRLCFSFLYGLLFFLHVLFFFYILYKAAHLFCTWSFDSSNTWCLFIRQDSKLILTIKFQVYPFSGFFQYRENICDFSYVSIFIISYKTTHTFWDMDVCDDASF